MIEWLTKALKTLSETDSRRLRRLETTVMEIQDDGEKFLRLAERINARLRGRASRAAASADDGEDRPADDSADRVDGNGGALPRAASLVASQQAPRVAPVFTKAQLREFARQKGIRA